MTKQRRGLSRRRDSTRHFLFSKTDAKSLTPKRLKPKESTWRELKQLFPDVLAGKRFIDQAVDRLDTSAKFGAMAIKFDILPPNDKSLAKYKAITQALDTLCKKENGSWGILEHGLLGGFFPEKDAPVCLRLAQQFQTSLNKNIKETVTIGIAAHPTLAYPKQQVMDNARKALVHAAFFGPNSAQIFDAVSLNISGDQLYEKGNINAAIEEFTSALKIDSSNVNVRNSLGVCYGVQADYKKAVNQFKTAIELEPEEYMAVYNQGLVSMLNDEKDKALDFFLHANKIAEDVFEIAFQTGRLCLEKGDLQRAKDFLERASGINPKAGGVLRYLGECYAALGQTVDAIAAYKKAVKYNPGDAASLSALGCLFDEQGENPEIAIMFCRESVGLAPENGLFRHRLGQLYLKQNQLEDALKQFMKADTLGHGAVDVIQKVKNQIKANAS
jgi:tetratricopeptide (TPR) repeat protein